MRIIKGDVQKQWEQNYKKEDFISSITEQIFMICKFDNSFNADNNLDKIDGTIEDMKKKNKNKDELLVKSSDMRELLVNKMTELENENFKIKINLLESLGAEL